MDSYSLKDQLALVTGAAQGLGLGIAQRLARNGAKVVMTDVQEAKLDEAAAALCEAGLSVVTAVLDVADSGQVETVFGEVARTHGELDVLVNNAGVGQDVCPVTEMSDAQWQRVLEVTLSGAFYCCRAAGAMMERRESGTIVNVASVNGQSPAPLVAAYNAAKAGVISLTKTLALELSPYGVRVNAVSPGPVYTDFNQRVMEQRAETLGIATEEMVERVRKAIPLRRWGEADDIAQGVAFLCSPAAGWITGEVLTVGGGLTGVSASPPKRPRG